MNGVGLKDYRVLFILESSCFRVDNINAAAPHSKHVQWDTVQAFDQQCQRLLPYPVNDEMRSATTNPSALPRVDSSEIG